MGNCWHKELTSLHTLCLSFPLSAFCSLCSCKTSAIKLATLSNSCTPNPRVVAAGVPNRIPEVIAGFSGSNGTPFLLQVIPTDLLKQLQLLILYTKITQIYKYQMGICTIRNDINTSRFKPSESAVALATTFDTYFLNDGCCASPNATVLPLLRASKVLLEALGKVPN